MKQSLEEKLGLRDIIRSDTHKICGNWVAKVIKMRSFKELEKELKYVSPESYLRKGVELEKVLLKAFPNDEADIRAYCEKRRVRNWFNSNDHSELWALEIFEKVANLTKAEYELLPHRYNLWPEIIEHWFNSNVLSKADIKPVMENIMNITIAEKDPKVHEWSILELANLYYSKFGIRDWRSLRPFTEFLGRYFLEQVMQRGSSEFTIETYDLLFNIGHSALNIKESVFNERMEEFKEGLIAEFKDKFVLDEEYDYQDDPALPENYTGYIQDYITGKRKEQFGDLVAAIHFELPDKDNLDNTIVEMALSPEEMGKLETLLRKSDWFEIDANDLLSDVPIQDKMRIINAGLNAMDIDDWDTMIAFGKVWGIRYN